MNVKCNYCGQEFNLAMSFSESEPVWLGEYLNRDEPRLYRDLLDL